MCSALCSDTYPDIVCRGNFSRHYYDPPLLCDLNSDPGEIYWLDPTLYSDVLTQIDKVGMLQDTSVQYVSGQYLTNQDMYISDPILLLLAYISQSGHHMNQDNFLSRVVVGIQFIRTSHQSGHTSIILL